MADDTTVIQDEEALPQASEIKTGEVLLKDRRRVVDAPERRLLKEVVDDPNKNPLEGLTISERRSMSKTAPPEGSIRNTLLLMGATQEQLAKFETQPEIGIGEDKMRIVSAAGGDLSLMFGSLVELFASSSIGSPPPPSERNFQTPELDRIASAFSGDPDSARGTVLESGALETIRLLHVVKRLQADDYGENDELFAHDFQTMKGYLLRREEERVRGMSTGRQIAGGIAELPFFMASFLISGGAASVAKKAAQKGLTAIVGKQIRAGVRAGGLKKVLTKGAVKVVEVGATTMARMPFFAPEVGKQFTQEELNANIVLTKKGYKILNEPMQDSARSLQKALGNTFIEVFTEGLGGPVTKTLLAPGARLAARGAKGLASGLSQIAGAQLPKWASGMKGFMASQLKVWSHKFPNKKVGEFFTKAGYNGFVEELEEEQIAALWQAAMGFSIQGGTDNRPVMDRMKDSVFGWDEWKVTAGIVAFPGMARLTAGQAVQLVQKQKEGQDVSEPDVSKIIPNSMAEQIANSVDAKGRMNDLLSGQTRFSDEIFGKLDSGDLVLAPAEADGAFVFLDKEGNEVKSVHEGDQVRLSSETAPTFVESAPPAELSDADVRANIKASLAEEDALAEAEALFEDQGFTPEEVAEKVAAEKVRIQEDAAAARAEREIAREKAVKDKAKAKSVAEAEKKKDKTVEEKLLEKGKARRASEEAEVLLKDAEKLEDQKVKAVAKLEKKQDAVESKLDTAEGKLVEALAKRQFQADNFQSTKASDNAIADLKGQVKLLESQQKTLAREVKSTTSEFEKKVDEALTKADTLVGQVEARDVLSGVDVKGQQKLTLRANEVIAALKQKQAEGVKITKAEIKEAQTELIKRIRDSGLAAADQGRFLSAVKNTQSIKQLEKAFPKLSAQIENLREKAFKKDLLRKLKRKLKATRPKRTSGKPVGKFTPEIQDTLNKINEFSKMPRIEADLRAKNMLDELQKKGELPTVDQFLELGLLNDVSDLQNRPSSELAQILKRVEDLTERGRKSAINKKLGEIEERNKDIAVTLDGLQSDELLSPTASPADRVKARKVANKDSFGASVSGWNDIMEIFFRSNLAVSEARFMNATNVTQTELKEKGDVFRVGQEINLAGMEAFGVTKEKQFAKILEEGAVEKELGVFSDTSGQDVNLILSKNEARKMWMELQDPSLRETIMSAEGGYVKGNVRIKGVTPEMETAVEEFLTPEDRAFAKAQLKIYRGLYDVVNKQYKKDFNTDLPFNDFYSPIRRQKIQANASQSLLDEFSLRKGVGFGSLKDRTANHEPLRVQSDIEVMHRHVAESMHYVNWSDKIKTIDGIFNNAAVRNEISERYGEDLLKITDKFISDFKSRGTQVSGVYGKWLDMARTNFTVATLALKPALTLKQMASIFAYSENIPAKDFVKNMIGFWANPIKNYDTLAQTDLLLTRGTNMTRDIQDVLRSKEMKAFNTNPSFRNMMLVTTRLGDRWAIVWGGWAVYKHTLDTTGSAEKAVIAFQEATSQAQQSSLLSQQSDWQRGGSAAKLFTMFTSAQNQYMRRELSAIRNLRRGKITWGQFAKKMFIYHLLLPQIWQLMANFGEIEEGEQVRAGILGSFNGVFLLGDVLDSLTGLALNAFTDNIDDKSIRKELEVNVFDPASIPLDSIWKGFEKASRKLKADDFSTEDVLEALGDLGKETVGPLTGIPVKRIFDSYDGVDDIMSGKGEKGLLKLAGWSPWMLDKRDEDGGGRPSGRRSRSRSRNRRRSR